MDVAGLCCNICAQSKSPLNHRQQWCTVCGGILFCYLVVGSIIQFFCFHFATLKCSSLPDDYSFPGGGHGQYGGPEIQLIARRSMVVERDPMWYGAAFDVYNATEVGTIAGAPIGVWYRTWGPYFSTYTYQDVLNSQPTVYMRSSIAGMFLYNEDWVMRCDGKGTPMRLTEGANWVGNRIRHVMGANQGFTFNIWKGGKIVATAEETFHGAKSMTFRNITTKQAPEFASSVKMQNQGSEAGKNYARWFTKNDYGSSIPFWQTNAFCTLYAFRIYNMGSSTTSKAGNGFMSLARKISPFTKDDEPVQGTQGTATIHQ